MQQTVCTKKLTAMDIRSQDRARDIRTATALAVRAPEPQLNKTELQALFATPTG
jgi:hypothetical protein